MLNDNKKFCQQCQNDGKKSMVYQGMATRTLMAPAPSYWDEDGNFHQPEDPNITTIQYSCSEGHTWEEKH